ncbi:phosphatidate cytidylyltransferase [Helicobacter cetorum]|uniref:Phosphatidate cytidylyltransferase n=1 Tax=Helicobacter cetorum (strain ATCC BAA-540 / CCUG 52418 / MIT 99-5656) TaxID=1163745 RepID=I0EUH4_HELCM|nr:phosphatidate cytidylyltransferase [Helicobacter cetorum]AFI06593.1 phosphatidate cytidylyltransferase [Helicobacter cetorum MIT 99-5656]
MKEKLLKEKSRYITGLILIAVASLILYADNLLLFWVVLGGVYLIGFSEALKLFQVKTSLTPYLILIASWVLAYFNGRPMECGLLGAMVMASIIAYQKAPSSKVILPFLYPGVGFFALFGIYKDFGTVAIIWLLVVVVISDVGAFFGGKLLGKTPFTPTSPNKTLEGAFIGVALASVVGAFVGMGKLSGGFFMALFFSFLISLFAVFGDLYESYLKRQAKVKDSGKILPGHGGILDRLDAMLFGALSLHVLLYFLGIWKEIAVFLGD